MALRTNNFNISGFIAQPNGINPVAGDATVFITNDGVASNSGTPFLVNSAVLNGEFTQTYQDINPRPQYIAATGDTLTFQVVNVNTGAVVNLNVNGTIQASITRTLSDQDVGSISSDPSNPIGALSIFLTLADRIDLHSNDVVFNGTVLQPDGTTPVPDGLQIFVENLTKSSAYTVPVLNRGEFDQNISGSPGFTSGDQIRLSVLNSINGTTVPIIVGSNPAVTISRALLDEEIIEVGVNPNKGRVVQSFKLRDYFAGILVAPTTVTTEVGDKIVTVRWSQSYNSDLASYILYRSLTPSGPFFNISGHLPVNQTQYIDTNIFNDVSYYYRVSITLTDGRESPLSVTKTAVPATSDRNFTLRQILTNKYISGRSLSISYMVARLTGSNQGLSVVLKYKISTGAVHELVISNPDLPNTNILQPISDSATIPDATEMVDIRFRQEGNSSYIIDNIVLKISGNTVDTTARNIISPSYNSDKTKIILKNRLPGDLILLDLATKNSYILAQAGDFSDVNTNSTEDPVTWTDDDKTIAYSFYKGVDSQNQILSCLKKTNIDLATNTASLAEIIPDTTQGFFPKITRTSTGSNLLVYAHKSATSSVKSIGLVGDNASKIIVDCPKLRSLDIDGSNIVFSTDTAILINDLAGGQSQQVLTEGSELVLSGRKAFIPGKLVAYLKTGTAAISNDLYEVAINEGSSVEPRGEYLLDTTQFPDGLLNIKVRAKDGASTTNTSIVEINTIINNSYNLRPMYAKQIREATNLSDASRATAPGAIVGGITNKTILMMAGVSSANRGRLEFITRDDNRVLSIVEDVFKYNPQTTVVQSVTDALPIKLRFTWFTDLIPSEPGGILKEAILTVDTGGVVRNIFIPEITCCLIKPIDPCNNCLVLYVAEDGSTYYDPQLKQLARQATKEALVKIAPELDDLPKFTNANKVLLQWCNDPGSPLNMIAHYSVLRSTDPNTGFVPIYTSIDNQVTNYNDIDIIDGVAYFYKIQAIDLLGNTVAGNKTVFTIIDRTKALEQLGHIQVDLNIDDLKINDDSVLEAGTGKVYSPRTTFSLSATKNANNPPISTSSEVYADYTFQKPDDVVLFLQPVTSVDAVVGDVSGVFVRDQDYMFIKDNNIQSGSYKARDKIRWLRSERKIVEEQVVRGAGDHTADALSRLFLTSIQYASMMKVITEPVTPVSGFLLRLTNTEPGKFVNGKRQNILDVREIRNVTQNVSYEVNDIIPNYSAWPQTLLQLDVFTNMAKYPYPNPTDEIYITYSYMKVFPSESYKLNRSQNTIEWIGDDPAQPKEGENYFVTYKHLCPIPGERITIDYTVNGLIRLLQFGNVKTGVRGLEENRHICADVLARETTPIPVDIQMLVRLYDTADEGFTTNQIISTVGSLFNGKKLGQGIRISDISNAVQSVPEVSSLKLDPFTKLGRTDTPNWLKIYLVDLANYSVAPGHIEGEVTFYTLKRPASDIVIPAKTVVSNDFTYAYDLLLFETTNTFTAPMDIVDSYYNEEKNRYEFKVKIRAMFTGAMSIGRKQIVKVGGILSTTLEVENEEVIEGAIASQEEMTGNGTLTLTVQNGQLMKVINVSNYSALAVENMPLGANFIKLSHSEISNARGNKLGAYKDSSLIFDDTIVFKTEVIVEPSAPGEYYVNYKEGYIKTYSKTANVNRGLKIRYKYLETYDVAYAQISSDKKSFALYAPTNAGKPSPQPGDYILTTYQWSGDGVSLEYRIETFSTDSGILDFSFITADDFSGPIFVNNRSERIENINTHPEPPFYTYNKTNRQLSLVGRTLTEGEEIIFRFNTPFGDIDLAMTTYDVTTQGEISRFTFNVDYRSFQIKDIQFLEMGGDSVQSSPGIIINAGLTQTKERNIVIQLAALNAKNMMFSQDPLFRDKTDLDFESFSTTKMFYLEGGDGLKTVYVKIRFNNTAIQDVVLESDITLDTISYIGQFIPITEEEFNYDSGNGILRIPTSFGQSDVVINDMESVSLNSLTVEIDPQRAKRVY